MVGERERERGLGPNKALITYIYVSKASLKFDYVWSGGGEGGRGNTITTGQY